MNSINSSTAKNFEAYELYLRGRHLLYQNNPKAVERSIEYLQKSIELDSSYAPAYVSLAEALIIENGTIRNHEEKLVHREQCYKAIDKALVLNPTLAEAYITKGNMIGKFSWNWEEMKKMAEKGLIIEPNNSYGHMLLSKYYLIKNDYEGALKQVLKAEKLDPLNPGIGCFVAENYFLAQDYKKALDQYEKVIKTFPNYPMAWEGAGHVLFESGNKKEALAAWGKFHDFIGNDDLAEVYSKESFENSMNIWLDGVLSGDAVYCPFPTTVSYVFLFIDNKTKSLEYLDIAYKYRDQDLPISLISPHYYSLYDNSQFRDIANETGVVLPEIKQTFEVKQ
jgi:tetratricopeptide (TPR) repeat protein